MKPNPGGQLDADEIIGRDSLIADMWEVLSGRNIYMNDLRRIGKTMILSKMQSAPPEGWLVSKRDFEGLRTANEFATQVFRDALNLQSREKRIFKRMSTLLGNVNEFEVPRILKIKLSDRTGATWKEVLTQTLADLHDAYSSGSERVVFLWDEIPMMIENILENEGSSQAMEVLDTLRSLSQDYPNIRFVLTGSVGIHHILERLRQNGYNNSPLNTFERIAPGPLTQADAVHLAHALIHGAGLSVQDRDATAETVAKLAGNVPFYIHRLISRMVGSETVSAESISKLLEKELCSGNNDWDFDHYRNRLEHYYQGGNDETVVLALLDSLAVAADPLPLFQLLNETKSVIKGVDDEQIRSLLKRLIADHYLIRNDEGHYRFYLEIIRRWWVLDRGL